MKTLENFKSSSGFAAILTVLIVISVVLIYGLSLNYSNILGLQMTTARNVSQGVFHFANTCMEEALVQLRRDESYVDGSLNLTEGNCTISIVAAGDNRIINVTAVHQGYYQSLEMSVDLVVEDSSHNFISQYWEEK